MNQPVKHVPKHRGAPRHAHVALKPKKALRTSLLFSTVAVAATGGALAGGLVGKDAAPSSATAAAPPSSGATEVTITPDALALAEADVATRGVTVSRSADRAAQADTSKAQALAVDTGLADSGQEDLADADPRDIAKALLGEFGFGLDQFSCLDSLYIRESNWNVYADNPTSSAYGIPQALPGSKMASAGADWATNPVTQIRWGLGYIRDRYGSPCGAWGHSQSYGWY